MNKRILALGLAGALAMTSVVIPYSPTALSVEAAYVETSIYHEYCGMSFQKETSTPRGFESRVVLGIGETRTAMINGDIVTKTINHLSDATYIDEDFDVNSNQETYSYYHIKLSDLTDWKSSDEEVATVANGVVTAKAEGYTVITAKYTYKNQDNEEVTVTFSAPVVVKKTPGDELLGDVVDLGVGSSYTISPKFFKTTIDPNTIEYWFDEDEFGDDVKWDGDVITGSIATFDTKTGIITAKDVGRIEIYVEAYNTDGDGDWSTYTFNITAAYGTTVKDWNNTGKYTILNSKEVSFAGALNDKAKLVIPGSVWISGKWYDVVEIADGALEGSNIKSVLIPDSVKKIGARAFKKCKKLKKVDLSSTDVAEIGDEAFCDCNKLKEVILNADKITKVGKKAFKGKKKGRKYYIVSSKKSVHKKFVKKLKKAKAKGKFLEQNMLDVHTSGHEEDNEFDVE